MKIIKIALISSDFGKISEISWTSKRFLRLHGLQRFLRLLAKDFKAFRDYNQILKSEDKQKYLISLSRFLLYDLTDTEIPVRYSALQNHKKFWKNLMRFPRLFYSLMRGVSQILKGGLDNALCI